MSVASVVGIVFGVIFGIALLLVVAFMVIKKMKGMSTVPGPVPGNDIDCLRQNRTL